MMRKRFLAVFTAVVMLCQMFAALPVFSAGEAEEASDAIIHMEDFEDGKASLSTGSSWLEQKIITDENGGKYMESLNKGIGTGANGSLSYPTIEFSEDENVQVVSIDLMFDKVDFYGHILIRSGVWTLVYSILGDGHIVASGNRQTAVGSFPAMEYEPGKWYTLTMVINKSSKNATFYANGISYGVNQWGKWSDSLTMVIERHTGDGAESNTMYIDNLLYGYEDAFVPYKEKSVLELVCEELGQTFWSKSVDFEIKVENVADVKKSYDVTTELVNDFAVTEYTKTDTVELEPGESKLLEFKTDLSRYAVYDIISTATDKETGESHRLESELVTMRKSEVQNPLFGIHDHAADSGDGYARYPEKFEALKNAGMSSLRMSMWWNIYETAPGVYAIPQKFIDAFECAKENDMDVLFINGFNNDVIVPGEWPPSSPHGIAAFANYAHQLAKDTEKWAYGYEVWNEWNVLDHFNRDQLSGAQYVDLIKPTYERIKAANPNAKVYGLSGMTWNRTDLYKQMAEEMFANGVADYCDGFSIHTYQGFQSPDTGAHVAGLEYTQGLMDQYGVGDKELIITEMGWQAHNGSPEEVATWIVKYAAMIHNRVDKIFWYCSQRKMRDVGAGEQSYGWMQDENETADYVPYAPLPQLRAMTSYNSYIATSEKTDEIEITDGNAVIHRFKRTDGKEVLMAWVKDGSDAKTYAINLGAQAATVSDIYGNETEYVTDGGKLYITLTNSPQYIIGNFGEISAEGSSFAIGANEVFAVADDMWQLKVTKDSRLENVKVEVELPADMTVSENNGFNGNEAEVIIGTGSLPAEESTAVVKVVDKTTGAIYYSTNVLVKRTDKCMIDVMPKLDLNGRWKIGITINNMKQTSSISGEAEITEPVLREDGTVKFSFDNLGAQSKITKYIFIPAFWGDNTAINTVKCNVTLDTGESFAAEEAVSFNGIVSTTKAPVIDGVISDGEWNKKMPFTLNNESHMPEEVETTWDGPEDLSAKFYYNWDNENLYVAAEVVDNVHWDSIENKTWQNDGIQIAFAVENDRTSPRTELGFSLYGGKPLMERTAWMPIDTTMLGGIQDDGDFGDTEYKIRRDGTMTYYELKIPWEEIGDDGFNILDYDGIYMSILLNDNDGAGRRGWLETCPGIGYIKSAITFEKVKRFR